MKIKRMLSVLLCLLTLVTTSARALDLSEEDALELYSGMVGHIAFSLPDAPQRVQDQDFPGLWVNSVQLFGYGVEGGEFQLRTADISEWIAGMIDAYPDEEEYHSKANALLQYAAFMIFQHEGELADMQAFQQEGIIGVSFTYTYPDTPGVAYEGRALLEGNTAVCLVGAACDELTHAFDRLRVVSDEQMQAYHAREPERISVGILSAEFPTPTKALQDDTTDYVACFASDFSYLGIQGMPIGFVIDSHDDELKSILIDLAQSKVIPSINGETVYNPELSMAAPDTALLTFSTVNTEPFGEDYGQKFLCRLYVGERGIYYVYAADTETGAAFMDSIKVMPGSVLFDV